MTDRRPLQPAERALLDAFLAVDFDGVEALHAQAPGTTTTPGCAPLPLPPAERVRWTTRPEPAPKQPGRRRRT